MKLDLSNLKKISQDKDSATFHHPDGHEIKVATAMLKPEMRKKLKDLPVHQANPDAPIEAIEEPAAAAPAVAEQATEPAPQADAAAPAEAPPAQTAPAQPAPAAVPSDPTMGKEAPVAAGSAVPVPEAKGNEGPAVAPVPAPVQLTPEQEAQQMLHNQMQFGDDLAHGHIKPKTYHELYADKGVLGKIGTIFGLLVGGAGSGLSHQPNALLDMMNKELERDYDAQKTEASNKQNWYRMSLDHNRLQSENAFRGAQTDEARAKAARSQWENEQAGVVDADALNHQSAGMVQSLQDLVNKMPPGPQRDAAQAKISNEIIPSVLNQAMQRNLNATQKKSVLSSMSIAKSNPPPKGEAKPGMKYDAVDENKLANLIQKSQFTGKAIRDPKTGAYLAIDPHDKDAIDKEVNELKTNRNNLADADDSFRALAEMPRAGQAPISGALQTAGTIAGGLLGGGPIGATIAGGIGNIAGGKAGRDLQSLFERKRDIQKEALKARLGGNMSDADKESLVESILPSWKDMSDEKSTAEAHRKMVQHFESNPAENAPKLTRYGIKYPLPQYTWHPPKESKESGSKESFGGTGLILTPQGFRKKQ